MRPLRFLVILSAVGALFFGGARLIDWSKNRVPSTMTIEAIELSVEPESRFVTVTGGRGDLIAGAFRLDAKSGGAIEVYFPVRPAASGPASIGNAPRLVVASRAPELLIAVASGGKSLGGKDATLDVFPERAFTGLLHRPDQLDDSLRREIDRLAPSLAKDWIVLVEGGALDPIDGVIPIGGGVLLFVLAWILGTIAPKPASKPVERFVSPRDLPRGAAPASSPTPVVDPPAESIPPPKTTASVPGTPALRPAPEVPAPSEPPVSDAEEKRRLFDYSSIATVGPEELLRRFRFVAEKVVASEAGLRVFPFVGRRPFEIRWAEVTFVAAYRCPNLTPWHDMLVVELGLTRDERSAARAPIRLALRTSLDFGPFSMGEPAARAEVLRRFAREVALRADGASFDDATRAFLDGKATAPQFLTLRELARHDARFLDVR